MTMHRLIIVTTLTVLVLTTLTAAVLAQEIPSPINRLENVGTAAGYSDDVGTTSIATTVGGIIKMFRSILGMIFLSYMVYAGYLWMTASGEEEKLRKAKAIIRGSIIGLIIALSGYIITATVVDRVSTAAQYGEVRAITHSA